MSPSKINWFLLFKLPAAFFTGVRVRSINRERCVTTLKYGWKNQNPFRSVFWAVQGMAAELSTGALVMQAIRESGANISMLVTSNQGSFLKKAQGRITFECDQGDLISEKIREALATGEGENLVLSSKGVDEAGDVVSLFEFEWSLKRRKR